MRLEKLVSPLDHLLAVRTPICVVDLVPLLAHQSRVSEQAINLAFITTRPERQQGTQRHISLRVTLVAARIAPEPREPLTVRRLLHLLQYLRVVQAPRRRIRIANRNDSIVNV